MGSYWSKIVQGTPIADPDIAQFASQLKSYAALQAAAHGFRGSNVMVDFEKGIGGPATNPEALKRGIDGIAETMKSVQKQGAPQHQSSPAAAARPRAVNGKGEAVEYDGKAWVPVK